MLWLNENLNTPLHKPINDKKHQDSWSCNIFINGCYWPNEWINKYNNVNINI